jgi:glycosyltransferase involved in cell wall biosynthesis
MKSVKVIGWLNVPHSFAIVNYYQLRSLSRAGFLLAHETAPFLVDSWAEQERDDLFSGAGERLTLDLTADKESVDFIYTIFYPFDLRPRKAVRKTFVFGVNEYQELSTKTRDGNFFNAFERDDFKVVTPSAWSKEGYLKYGFNDDQVLVVPHGYDSNIFQPRSDRESVSFLGVRPDADLFYFGSLGTMTFNKGIDVLLKGFLILAEKHPHIRLILKEASVLGYPTVDEVLTTTLENEPTLRPLLSRHASKILTIRQTLSQLDMVNFYQFIDSYVSPYRAEGFGLTPLEAAGCGASVILTSGGSTVEYFDGQHMRGIDSILTKQGGKTYLEPRVDSLIQSMEEALADTRVRDLAERTRISSYFRVKHDWQKANERFIALFS